MLHVYRLALKSKKKKKSYQEEEGILNFWKPALFAIISLRVLF